MEYNKLVSVTGMGGLYEMVSSKADGGLVRSLEDKSTKFVSNRVHSFSHLESIEVYTKEDNVNLAELFIAMKNNEATLPDGKADGKEIKAYFEKVYPDMDFERVYVSDMKKMVRWYDILVKNDIEIKLSDKEDESAENFNEKKNNTAKTVAPKSSALHSAPAKKINSPRKMA